MNSGEKSQNWCKFQKGIKMKIPQVILDRKERLKKYKKKYDKIWKKEEREEKRKREERRKKVEEKRKDKK